MSAKDPTEAVDRLVSELAIPREEARRLWYNLRGSDE